LSTRVKRFHCMSLRPHLYICVYTRCRDNQGSVPNDVNLLPGQLRDVKHAVHQIPVPALPPLTLRHRPHHKQNASERHVAPRRSSMELPPVPSPTMTSSTDVVVDESRLPPVDYGDDDDDDEVKAYAIGDGRVSVRLCNGIAKWVNFLLVICGAMHGGRVTRVTLCSIGELVPLVDVILTRVYDACNIWEYIWVAWLGASLYQLLIQLLIA